MLITPVFYIESLSMEYCNVACYKCYIVTIAVKWAHYVTILGHQTLEKRVY